MLKVQTPLLGEGQSDCALGHQMAADRCNTAPSNTPCCFFLSLSLCCHDDAPLPSKNKDRQVRNGHVPISVKSLDMFAIKLEYKQRMHMLGSLLHLQYSPFSIHIKKRGFW